jgi:hypothetical protein
MLQNPAGAEQTNPTNQTVCTRRLGSAKPRGDGATGNVQVLGKALDGERLWSGVQRHREDGVNLRWPHTSEARFEEVPKPPRADGRLQDGDLRFPSPAREDHPYRMMKAGGPHREPPAAGRI